MPLPYVWLGSDPYLVVRITSIEKVSRIFALQQLHSILQPRDARSTAQVCLSGRMKQNEASGWVHVKVEEEQIEKLRPRQGPDSTGPPSVTHLVAPNFDLATVSYACNKHLFPAGSISL